MMRRTLALSYLVYLLVLTVSAQEEHELFVSEVDLAKLSSTVLASQTWVKNHVLNHSLSTKITTIVVGKGLLCNKEDEHQWNLVLPCMRNLYHSLVRLSLANEVKVSIAFSPQCLSSGASASPLKKRKLSSLSVPSFGGHQFSPVPSSTFSFAPLASPPEVPELPTPPPPPPLSPEVPAMPPVSYMVPPPSPPPCSASPGAEEGPKTALWCVAKPAVPSEKLQEAIDFACGEGADCEEIQPNGRCYFPDNVVAHASYAFNSYWQKWKHNGGTCGFDGTALLIDSDPSFLECHFELS
ncbi:X8 domain-containing protein [Dioscorea alata]|uniref:X8 domain-containing protein n=1 Tax=Dioscorea alata TaxID=55571 RepID=A0ACB7VH24_DIOAL|nr:X8 domain-containing protein [Dioscorea alata]